MVSELTPEKEREILIIFNNAKVVVVPKSLKAEMAVSLVKKFTQLEFTVEKEPGIIASIRSVVSSIIVGVISIIAQLAGYF